jgi:hypothetical protein
MSQPLRDENIYTPLGLPAGSIRGLFCLLISATFWMLLLVPDENKVPISLNLYFLLSMVMVFFVAHGATIARKSDSQSSPFHLPSGTIRFLILGGTIGVVAYLYAKHPDHLQRLTPNPDEIPYFRYHLASLIGGFFFGVILRVLPLRHGWMFQSFQAWLAIVALASIVIEIILQAFVRTTILQQVDLLTWQCAVTAIVACYFGTRS